MMALARLVYALGRLPLLGGALRRVARRYPEGSVVSVRAGLCKGLRWKRHHRYINGYWIGIAEPMVQDQLVQHLKTGDVFYDVGANAGYFTLMAAHIVGDTGRVVAFDPLPENIESVREQIELNDFSKRTSLYEKALSDSEGTAEFSFGAAGDSTARLGQADDKRANTLQVELTTLDKILENEPAPTLIKMDVEGAEAMVLRGAQKMLHEHKPTIILEVHKPEIGEEIRGMLGELYEWINLEEPSDSAPWHVLLKAR